MKTGIHFKVLFVAMALTLESSSALPTRSFINSNALDLTLSSGANGEEVVEACIKKLSQLAVFGNDYGLMMRIAKVETDFGTSYPLGLAFQGIWQISTSEIAFIQSNILDPSITTALSQISSFYGASFVDFSNFDLTIPFHAAIAARIYVELLLTSTSTPGSIADQALWWSVHYHPGGDLNQFEATITGYENLKQCPLLKLDLWFLLDDSSSVGDQHFATALDFIRILTRKFVIGSDSVRVGLSQYSSTITTVSKFNEHTDNTAFESALDAIVRRRGKTFSGSAISDVINNEFSVANGARPYSDGVPRALILMTDGYSSDPVTQPAIDSHLSGVTTFAIGIGDGIKAEEIRIIASHPSTTYAYTLEDYDGLASALMERLSLQFCKLSSLSSVTLTSYLTGQSGNPKYSFAFVPSAGYITIDIQTTNTESATMYFGAGPNPSPSHHLSSLQVTPGNPLTLIIAPSTVSVSNSDFPVLAFTGHVTYSSSIPLYMTAISQGSNGLAVEITVTSTPTAPTTTTPITTTSSTLGVLPLPDNLELWETLIIVVGAILAVLALVSLGFIAFGIAHSTAYPHLSNSCVFSACQCVLTSAAY